MCIRDSDNGHTVVVISHDMDYVAENSSRIIMMAQGEILDATSPDRAFLNAGTVSYTHLDVYKRQILECARLFLCRPGRIRDLL